jgi:hypothetical protein
MKNSKIAFKGLLFSAEDILNDYIKMHNKLFTGNPLLYLKKVDYKRYEDQGSELLARLGSVGKQVRNVRWGNEINNDSVESFQEYLIALNRAVDKFVFIMSSLGTKSRGESHHYTWSEHRKLYKEYNKLCEDYGNKGILLQNSIIKAGIIDKKSVGTTVADAEKGCKKVRVLVKGWMPDVQEEVWELNQDQINEFCDSDGVAYGFSVLENGERVNNLMNKTLWDKFDEVLSVISDSELTEQQKQDEIKRLGK